MQVVNNGAGRPIGHGGAGGLVGAVLVGVLAVVIGCGVVLL